jgi:nicotinamidase/pyrazinamidase
MKRALLLIDIQNDFLPGGPLAVPDGDAVIEVANRIIPSFKLIVATQDWHPPDHGSFAANHPGRQVGDQVELGGLPQILWPVHCIQNTRGAEIADGLIERERFVVFRKGVLPNIDSYSGFFDNGHRNATGLEAFLKKADVSHLYLMGLATDYCVKFTVVDACRLCFQAHVVQDGCRAVNLQPGDDARAFAAMCAAGAELTTSAAIRR